MADKYIVSFGESSKYVASDPELISHVTELLRRQMAQKFPSLGRDRLPEPKIEKVHHPERYAGYPELTEAEVPAIFRSLSVTDEDRRDTKALNNDAPWSDI